MNPESKKIIDTLNNSTGKVTLLADAFVDEVWEIISSRTNNDEYLLYTKMSNFAKRITDAGAGGVGLELMRKRRTFGGFTTNTGYALARLGVATTAIGVYGKGNIDPVFDEFGSLCSLVSVGDPGVTHIFEFDDGKVMMTHMGGVANVRWSDLCSVLGTEKTVALLAQSDIIGIGYWSLLPAFDEIVSEICAHLPKDGKIRRFFFDFADFRKKSEDSLLQTLDKLKALNASFPITLSVNEHEAAALFGMFGESFEGDADVVAKKAELVRIKLGFDEFVIHTPYFAVVASSQESPVSVPCVFCEKPQRTAGAGDTFNAGYMAASVAGLSMVDRLNAANASVGYFLHNAIYPNTENMAEYMDFVESVQTK